MRNQPPGLTSEAMRSRAAWGFGSCVCVIFSEPRQELVAKKKNSDLHTHVQEEEADVDDVERTGVKWQGICQDVELLEVNIGRGWPAREA
jgi:hypothetical protein